MEFRRYIPSRSMAEIDLPFANPPDINGFNSQVK